MENIIAFVIIITVQLLVFLFVYKLTSSSDRLFNLLLKSGLFGLLLGIVFDLMIGHYAGVYTYTFGFPLWFLALNGFFSWGLCIATVWCLTKTSFFRFYAYCTGVAVAYEFANYLSPVWEWTFLNTSWSEYLVVVFVAYAGLALLIAFVMGIIFKTNFAFFQKNT